MMVGLAGGGLFEMLNRRALGPAAVAAFPFVSRDKLTVLASKKDNPAEQIFVFWADEEKLGVAPVKK